MKNWTTQIMTATKWSYLSVLALGLLFTSCEAFFEELEEELQPVVDFVEDLSEIQQGLEDAMTLAEDAITITMEDGTTGYLAGECAVVTNDVNQDILTIDFGADGCVGLSDMERSGSIIINYLDEEDPDGYSYSIDFQTYKVGGNTFEGKLTIDNLHRNDDNQLEFGETIENARVTLANGKWYAWDSERSRKMVLGDQTEQVMDDVFQIDGSFDGRDHEGNQFTAAIVNPITFSRACIEESNIFYPSRGRTRYTLTDKPTTIVDWGLGFCDKRVNLFQNNKWLIVDLK